MRGSRHSMGENLNRSRSFGWQPPRSRFTSATTTQSTFNPLVTVDRRSTASQIGQQRGTSETMPRVPDTSESPLPGPTSGRKRLIC